MNRLPERIYSLNGLKSQMKSVLIESVCSNFPNLSWNYNKESLQKTIDWNNLLSCASILHQSNRFEHLDTSLRIAQHCLNSTDTNDTQRLGSTVILEALTNKPAISLALKRHLIEVDYKDDIPLPLQLEILTRDLANAIIGKDDQPIFLNKFQREVYEHSKDKDLISMSAPTSAGKSFILERILLEAITQRNDQPITVVYIVPTRALINQVEQEIRTMLKDNDVQDVFLTTVPQGPNEETISSCNIFVFTQERLHWFRTESPSFKIDMLIVDEAHKIEDGNRGILLQQKIEELVSDFPDLKIYFSSPFTSNPEFLLKDLPESKSKVPIKTEFVAVNQNLIFVSQKLRKPLLWHVNLCTKEETIELGTIALKNRPTHTSKRLIFVAKEMADINGGNLIYANGAAEAEKGAKILADALPIEYSSISDDVKELINLVQKVVHKSYALAKVLEKKVAFHYGNMPLIIRQEIEGLFKKGDIHFIICTSTLLEGVNLPAKSIFIRKPTRGSGNPMNDADFWNLAGRAGRWGKEFQGNVICVEPDTWENKPTVDRSKQEITKAVDKVASRKAELTAFIKEGTPRNIANKNLDLEYGFAYFYIKYLRGILQPNDELTNELVVLFGEIKDTIKVPDDIIIRNPGISPIAQQNLLAYFENYTGDVEDLIPVFPESDDAVNNSYEFIVQKINEYLSGDPIQLAIYQAILIVNWMKGYPLPKLIENSYNYWQKREARTYDRVIREVMKDIEEFARFKFAKYSSCYVDLLRYYLRKTGNERLVDNIPELHIWLEFGVSQQTQISLIGLGLSRNTAIALSEFITNENLSRSECIEWLKRNDISTLDISLIMKREIGKTVNQ